MNIARILYPVKVLGPGNRIGIWMCGCARGCKGCSNPELWRQRPEYEITPEKAFMLIQAISSANVVDGFTITGGEPLDQAEELAKLIQLVKPVSDDILVYSGYLLEELQDRKDKWVQSILKNMAVLIDGAYVEDLNDNSVLRGSSNQQIHVFKRNYADSYHDYVMTSHNQIQNFTLNDGIVSVGIHHKGWKSV